MKLGVMYNVYRNSKHLGQPYDQIKVFYQIVNPNLRGPLWSHIQFVYNTFRKIDQLSHEIKKTLLISRGTLRVWARFGAQCTGPGS